MGIYFAKESFKILDKTDHISLCLKYLRFTEQIAKIKGLEHLNSVPFISIIFSVLSVISKFTIFVFNLMKQNHSLSERLSNLAEKGVEHLL